MLVLTAAMSALSSATAAGVRPAYNLPQGQVSRGGYRIVVVDWPAAPKPEYKKLAMIIPNGSQIAFWHNATVWDWQGSDLGALAPFFEGNMMFSEKDRAGLKIKHIDLMFAIAIGVVNPWASGINPNDWSYAPWDRVDGKNGAPPLKLP